MRRGFFNSLLTPQPAPKACHESAVHPPSRPRPFPPHMAAPCEGTLRRRHPILVRPPAPRSIRHRSSPLRSPRRQRSTRSRSPIDHPVTPLRSERKDNSILSKAEVQARPLGLRFPVRDARSDPLRRFFGLRREDFSEPTHLIQGRMRRRSFLFLGG